LSNHIKGFAQPAAQDNYSISDSSSLSCGGGLVTKAATLRSPSLSIHTIKAVKLSQAQHAHH